MKKPLLLSILLTIAAASGALAQRIDVCDSLSGKNGNISVYADPVLNEYITPVVVDNNEDPTLHGYRIQIYTGNDRSEAQKLKAEVQQFYSDQPAYLIYEPPYFKVRVGDFRNRLEAQKLYHDLKQTYEGILLVPDKVNFPKLHK